MIPYGWRHTVARLWVLVAVCVLCTGGCGSASLEPVEGTVTLDGRPLAATYILFQPATREIKGPFVGKTDNQGWFAMGPVGEAGRGVPAGVYRVSFTTAHSDQPLLEGTKPPPERVPARFRDASLEFEAPKGGTHQATFALKSR